MKLNFWKYQSSGNDFVIIKELQNIDTKHIAALCDRRFGIGADGLMLVNCNDEGSFNISFFNSDGSTDTLCGNGSLCAVDFANEHFKLQSNKFFASDGEHTFYKGNLCKYQISFNNCTPPLKKEPSQPLIINNRHHTGYFINTGSPHYIVFNDDIDDIDIGSIGKRLRHDTSINREGSNIDFVKVETPCTLKIRTFERGVEAETLGCGTGSVAAAITHCFHNIHSEDNSFDITINNKGGYHQITLSMKDGIISDIRLGGNPKMVFKGEIDI